MSKPKRKVRNLVVENRSPVDLKVKVARVDVYTIEESGSIRADHKRRKNRRDDFARQSAVASKKAATDAGFVLTETERRSLVDSKKSSHTFDETKRSEDTGSKVESSAALEAEAEGSGFGFAGKGSLKTSGSYAKDDTGTVATEDRHVKDSSTAELKSTGKKGKDAYSHTRGTADESAVSGFRQGTEARDLHVEDEHESSFQRHVEYGRKIYDDYVLVSAGSSKGFAMFDDKVQVAFVSAVSEFGKEICTNWRVTADRIYFDGKDLSDALPIDCQMELSDFNCDSSDDHLVFLEDFDFEAVLSDWKLTRYKDALVAKGLDDVEYWRGEKVSKSYLLSEIGMLDAHCEKFQDKLRKLRVAVLKLNAAVRKVEDGANGIGQVKKWLRKREVRKHSDVRTAVTEWIQAQPNCCAEDGVSAMGDGLPLCGQCKLKALTDDFAQMKKVRMDADFKAKAEIDTLKAEMKAMKAQSKKEMDTVKAEMNAMKEAMSAQSKTETDSMKKMQVAMELMKATKKAMKAQSKTEIDSLKITMETMKTATTRKIAALKYKGIASFRSDRMVERFRKWNSVDLAPTLDAMGALSEDQSEFRIGIEGVYRVFSVVGIGGEQWDSRVRLYINDSLKCDYSTVLSFVGRLSRGDTVKVKISANEINYKDRNWLQIEKL